MSNSPRAHRADFAHPQRSHITRKRGVYYFRKRLPTPHQGELALSLRTRHYRQAEALGERLGAVWFEGLRRIEGWAQMATADLAGLIRSWLDKELEVEWARSLAKFEGPSRGHPDFPDVEITPLEAEIVAWQDTRAMALEALHHRDYAFVAANAKRMVQDHGLQLEQEAPLANGLMQALIKLAEAMTGRLEVMASGDQAINADAPRKAVEAPPVSSAGSPEQGMQSTPAASAESANGIPADGPMLFDLLPQFISEMRRNDDWTNHTLRQNEVTYDHLKAIIGDKPPSAYGKRDASIFKAALGDLPDRYGNRKDWRGLTVQNVIERAKAEGVKPIGPKTVKRHMSAVGRLFQWLIENGHYEGSNPFHGFRYGSVRQRAKDKRPQWSDDQLRRLFRSPIWQGSMPSHRAKAGSDIIRDHQWWLPILGLYHGCRLEELASLRRSDIRTDPTTGTIYLDINANPEQGKSLKTPGSARKVPLHPFMQRIGFMEYAEKAAPKPDDMLFPELRPGGDDGKYGHYYTRMFSAYRRQIGLADDGVDFHSFRHTFITAAVNAGVPLDVASAIAGHETNGSITARVYFKGYELKALSEAMRSVSFPAVEEIIRVSATEPSRNATKG